MRDCLQPLSADRPRDARLLAGRLKSHFANVEERARKSELDAVASEGREAREQYARRRALVFATVALVAILGGGGVYLSWKGERDAREARAAPLIAAALREATGHEGERNWPEAVAVAQKAVDIAASEGADGAGAQELLARLEQEQQAAEEAEHLLGADDALLDALEKARAMGSDHYDSETIDASYVAAVERRWPSMNVDTGRLRDSPHAQAFATAFDVWAAFRRTARRDWRRPDTWARAIDPADNDLRDAIAGKNRAGLRALIEKEDLATSPAVRIGYLGGALVTVGMPGAATAFLERAHRKFPGDFWINFHLAQAATRTGNWELGLRHSLAALAIRPRSVEARHRLGIALEGLGDLDGALAAWRDAWTLQPSWTHGLTHIAKALAQQGRRAEAIAASEKAVATDPKSLILKANALEIAGERAQALAVLRQAVATMPESADVHRALGRFLTDVVRRYDEAIPHFEKALELAPDDAITYQNLRAALTGKKDFAGAVEAYRRAHEFDPDNTDLAAEYHDMTAYLLQARGDYDGAVRACREAIALRPTRAEFTLSLGQVLAQKGDIEAAKRAFREARELLRLHSARESIHRSLGNELVAISDLDGALDVLRAAVEAHPNSALIVSAHNNLGARRWIEQGRRSGTALIAASPQSATRTRSPVGGDSTTRIGVVALPTKLPPLRRARSAAYRRAHRTRSQDRVNAHSNASASRSPGTRATTTARSPQPSPKAIELDPRQLAAAHKSVSATQSVVRQSRDHGGAIAAHRRAIANSIRIVGNRPTGLPRLRARRQRADSTTAPSAPFAQRDRPRSHGRTAAHRQLRRVRCATAKGRYHDGAIGALPSRASTSIPASSRGPCAFSALPAESCASGLALRKVLASTSAKPPRGSRKSSELGLVGAVRPRQALPRRGSVCYRLGRFRRTRSCSSPTATPPDARRAVAGEDVLPAGAASMAARVSPTSDCAPRSWTLERTVAARR